MITCKLTRQSKISLCLDIIEYDTLMFLCPQMIYSAFDAGNFYVIPGSPAETLEAEAFMALQKDNLRVNMGYGPEDVIIAIVGSRFLYKGMWLGHAIVLRALKPLLEDFLLNKDNSSAQFRIIVHSEELTNNYTVALEVYILLSLFLAK